MSDSPKSPSRATSRAFTLVELLVALAVVTMLACLCLPALARVRSQTTQAQCAANLRQFALATQIYATERSGLLPTGTGGSWAWDLPLGTGNLLNFYGAQRQNMYCPANPAQNADGLWNYGLTMRVIGYAMTLQGISTVLADDQNPNIVRPTFTTTGSDTSFGPPGTVLRLNPSQRVLYADATISSFGQNNPALASTYQWTGIAGGYTAPGWTGHRTSHLNGKIPAGGNEAMLDGHVEWRNFTNMVWRAGGSAPTFWW